MLREALEWFGSCAINVHWIGGRLLLGQTTQKSSQPGHLAGPGRSLQPHLFKHDLVIDLKLQYILITLCNSRPEIVSLFCVPDGHCDSMT